MMKWSEIDKGVYMSDNDKFIVVKIGNATWQAQDANGKPLFDGHFFRTKRETQEAIYADSTLNC